ncbi:hypothetical protein T4D_16344 [Trichinella pseudospiralis]|uniref:Uncharacterized protein n=1 Tax=Trichinella pseudospiralis TaxID=6337 RepID=A0A0V1FII2_TRIPS|nr:hypothetical protein T4D_16344 [Trichinella pseudospiralis]
MYPFADFLSCSFAKIRAQLTREKEHFIEQLCCVCLASLDAEISMPIRSSLVDCITVKSCSVLYMRPCLCVSSVAFQLKIVVPFCPQRTANFDFIHSALANAENECVFQWLDKLEEE